MNQNDFHTNYADELGAPSTQIKPVDVDKSSRYWVCIIGPVPACDLPAGADYLPRSAARQRVHEMTGHDPVCSSGWCGEDEYERTMKARYERK